MVHVCVLQFRYSGEEGCLQKAIPARLCGFSASSPFSKLPYPELNCCHRSSIDEAMMFLFMLQIALNPIYLVKKVGQSGANLIDVNEATRSIYSEVCK
jgi:hypothetical protein